MGKFISLCTLILRNLFHLFTEIKSKFQELLGLELFLGGECADLYLDQEKMG